MPVKAAIHGDPRLFLPSDQPQATVDRPRGPGPEGSEGRRQIGSHARGGWFKPSRAHPRPRPSRGLAVAREDRRSGHPCRLQWVWLTRVLKRQSAAGGAWGYIELRALIGDPAADCHGEMLESLGSMAPPTSTLRPSTSTRSASRSPPSELSDDASSVLGAAVACWHGRAGTRGPDERRDASRQADATAVNAGYPGR